MQRRRQNWSNGRRDDEKRDTRDSEFDDMELFVSHNLLHSKHLAGGTHMISMIPTNHIQSHTRCNGKATHFFLLKCQGTQKLSSGKLKQQQVALGKNDAGCWRSATKIASSDIESPSLSSL